MGKLIFHLLLMTAIFNSIYAAEQAPKKPFKLPADAIVTRFVPPSIPAGHCELKYYAAYAAIYPLEINTYKGPDNRCVCAINHSYKGPLVARAQSDAVFKMLQSHDPAQVHAALVEKFQEQEARLALTT